jgi:tetratricopeptide (TPR) repeat protein
LADFFARQCAAAKWKVATAAQGRGSIWPRPGSHDLRLNTSAGLLLIVDYADRWPLSHLTWLFSNALLHHSSTTTRLLLLARSAHAWPAVASVLERVHADIDEKPLRPLPSDIGSRVEMFTAARDSFAARYRIADPSVIPTPNRLGEPAFGLTLTVHMAALAAVDAHHRGTRPPADPADLSAYLIQREAELWSRMFENRVEGLDFATPPNVMRRAVFAGALTGPLKHHAGLQIIADLGLETPAQRILDDHTACYPPLEASSAAVLEPLYPDRLAEDFLALNLSGHTVTGHPADPWASTATTSLLQSGREDTGLANVARVVTFLAEAAARWPHVGPGHLFPQLHRYPDIALAAGGPALAALAQVPNVTVDVLEAIEDRLPAGGHVDLDTGAAAITARLAALYRTASTDRREYARIQNNLAWRLVYAGRREEALAAAAEAVAIRRQLAAIEPAGHLLELAESLNNLGNIMLDSGRRNDALELMSETVAIRRRFAEIDPAHLPVLAMSLSNLGNILSSLGRQNEALAQTQEAVTIRRRLAEINPVAYLPNLASSLNSLGGHLSSSGQHDEALAAVEEVVAIFRPLAEADANTYLPDLAGSLTNLGVALSMQGRLTEAASPSEEAVDLYRRLCEANPGRYRAYLALSLGNLNNRLWSVGRRAEALAAAEESVAIRRELANMEPAAHLHDLAKAVNSLGNRLGALGRREEALAAAEESVAIRRALADAEPAAHLGDLAMALNGLGNRLAALGRREQALAAAEESVAIRRALADTEPAAHLDDLAMSLNNLGSHLSESGHHEAALAAAEESVAIRGQLAETQPGAYLPGLAASLNNFALSLSELGRGEAALAAAQQSVAIRRMLAKTGGAAHLLGVAESLSTYAKTCFRADTDLPAALTAVEEVITILGQHVHDSPKAFAAQLRSAFYTLADVLDGLGRADEANELRRKLQ